MPVWVWKQVRRKRSVSSTSIPDFGWLGSGSDQFDDAPFVALAVVVVLVGIRGVMERVIAWTLFDFLGRMNQQIKQH